MATTLNPRWRPIAFPVAPGTPLFEPVLVHGVGLLVAGGPQGLCLFDVGDRPGVQAKIAKRSWIDGFAVHGTSLYVQDGPVLIRYDILKAKPYAAINLVTGESWPGADEEDDPGELPDRLFELNAADTVLQNALHHARRAHGTLLGSGSQAAALSLKALETATRNAERISFSKPVVRSRQVDGRRLRGVFSLRMDGKLHATDNALQETETFAACAPLRAELVMAEMPQPNGQVRCLLHYISTSASIVAIDATGDMKLLPDWPARGIFDTAKVLPLRFVDGYLMGGGILGHDFFAMKPDPSLPPALTVQGPDGGWRQYDVAITDKLVVLSDGCGSRLVSYDPAAGTRDRWGLRAENPQAHSLFWTDTGSDGVVAGPRLLIEAGIVAANGAAPIALRAVLANTVDSPGNGLFADFPPPSTTLDTASLEPGNFPWSSKMAPLAFLPCRPLVSQQTLYCIYRSTPPADASGTYALAAFVLSGWLGKLLPVANHKLDEIRQNAKRSQVQVTWSVTTFYMLSQTESTDGPHAFGNTTFKILPQQGDPFEITTDGSGLFTLGGEYAGQWITIETRNMPAKSGAYLECKGVMLAGNTVNSLLLHGSKLSRT